VYQTKVLLINTVTKRKEKKRKNPGKYNILRKISLHSRQRKIRKEEGVQTKEKIRHVKRKVSQSNPYAK